MDNKLNLNLSAFKGSIKGDKIIWRIVLVLSFMSILLVYSSTSALIAKKGNIFYFLFQQSVYVGISLMLVYIFHNINVGYYRKLAVLGLLFSIALLILTLMFPASVSVEKNAHRWINIPIIGLTLQTSDIAKIALIVYLAKVLEDNNFKTFGQFALKVLLPIGTVCVLIIRGNFSTAALIGITSMCVLYIAGVKMRYLFNTIVLALVGMALIMFIGAKFPKVFPRTATSFSRVLTFLDDKKEKVNEEDKGITQADQAKMAVASGGVLGRGPGNSIQRFMLAEAHSDFVYAIAIEEYGIVGSIILLLMYLWLLFRAVVIAKKCTKKFPMIVVLGLMLLIVFQAMINMGVSVGIFPVTGQNLPLVSKGGTSMVFMGVAFGIILAISRAADEKEMSEEPTKVEA